MTVGPVDSAGARDGAYCKIYVDALPLDDAKALLSEMFGGRFRFSTMRLDGYNVEVRRNDSALGPGDDFVNWPLLVEFDAEDERGTRAAVGVVTRILRGLWENGHAVASCDYEEELPWSGGIGRLGPS